MFLVFCLRTFGLPTACSGYFLVIGLKKKKKDTKCKIHIQLTRHVRCLSALCPRPRFPIPAADGLLSQRDRPGAHSSLSRLCVVRDCGLVLSGGICSWSHSWTCGGSRGVCGGPGWCRTGTAGCRDRDSRCWMCKPVRARHTTAPSPSQARADASGPVALTPIDK